MRVSWRVSGVTGVLSSGRGEHLVAIPTGGRGRPWTSYGGATRVLSGPVRGVDRISPGWMPGNWGCSGKLGGFFWAGLGFSRPEPSNNRKICFVDKTLSDEGEACACVQAALTARRGLVSFGGPLALCLGQVKPKRWFSRIIQSHTRFPHCRKRKHL